MAKIDAVQRPFDPIGTGEGGVLASTRLKGKQPRVANMLVDDYLRPAAVKTGVLKEGEKVSFGFQKMIAMAVDTKARPCLLSVPMVLMLTWTPSIAVRFLGKSVTGETRRSRKLAPFVRPEHGQ